jgi:2'-5' RNA ligase
MDVKQHYLTMWKDSFSKFAEGKFEIDKSINSEDNRRGITLVVRPDEKRKKTIRHFLEELKSIEPNQYYYPDSDFHITILSIISCYDRFNLEKINIEKYVGTIENALKEFCAFDVCFKGITASPSCIMLQGFADWEMINLLRESIRNSFHNSGLEISIDKRYVIKAMHSTVMRFAEAITRKDEFLKVLEKYRDYEFGKCTINEIEFVYNDWYVCDKNTKVLRGFLLKSDKIVEL